MIGIMVVTHGLFGKELLHTAEDIVGRQTHTVGLAVTAETGADALPAAIDEALRTLENPDGVLIFVDMMGGSPCNAVLLKTKNLQAEVVSGVNLYMVLSAFRNRETLGLKELANKVTDDGKRAILQPKELLLKRLG